MTTPTKEQIRGIEKCVESFCVNLYWNTALDNWDTLDPGKCARCLREDK